MQIHEVKRENKLKKSRQIGRGGKRGTTSGRGTKGQKARSGHKMRPELRDIIKKLPKLRGYRFASFAVKTQPINLGILDKTFKEGDLISPKTLEDKKLVTKKSGKLPVVKILANGNLTKKLTFSGCVMSVSAKEKINLAGGTVK